MKTIVWTLCRSPDALHLQDVAKSEPKNSVFNLSYKKRNGLILLSFVFIIMTIGVYFSYFHFPSRIDKIQAEIKEIELKVEDIPRMQQELEA